MRARAPLPDADYRDRPRRRSLSPARDPPVATLEPPSRPRWATAAGCPGRGSTGAPNPASIARVSRELLTLASRFGRACEEPEPCRHTSYGRGARSARAGVYPDWDTYGALPPGTPHASPLPEGEGAGGDQA